MKELMKYPEVLNANDVRKTRIEFSEGEYFIEEKVDGSQFRFGIVDGEHKFGSHHIDYEGYTTDKMFQQAVVIAEGILKKVSGFDNIVFFAEYLAKPKQNALKYSRVPLSNFYLFDVAVDGKFVSPSEVIKFADEVGVEPVRVLEVKRQLPEIEYLDSIVNMESVLGGEKMEGVVIKNYDMNIVINGKLRFFSLKYVREKFRELNKIEHLDENKKVSPEDIVSRLINKEAVWSKAIQRIQEDGIITYEMRDIQSLIEAVKDDIEKEYKETIKEEMYRVYKKDIEKAVVRGLAEYYKKYLYEAIKGGGGE
jgi:hypothetical protein